MKKVLCFMAAAILALVAVFAAACGGGQGEIMRLEDAYEAGWLTRDELKNIAYYYNYYRLDDEEFVPAPQKPYEISDGTVNSIKKAYRTQIKEDENVPLEEIYVNRYCGTYRKYVVAEVTTYCSDILIKKEYEIGGVTFYNFFILYAWRK